jgi:hypothetical protein
MPPMWPGGPPSGGQGAWVYSPIYGWVWDPSQGNHPDNTLPPSGSGEHPDNTLPDTGNKPVNPIDPGGQPEPH